MRRMVKIHFALILCAAAILMLPMLASAELRPFYLGIQGGFVANESGTLEEGGAKADMDYDNGGAVGAKFGTITPGFKYLAFEFEYFYAKQDFNHTARIVVDGDLASHTFMLNLLARCPIGRVIPYVGAGLGFAQFELNATRIWPPFRTISDDDLTGALQARAGIAFEIDPNWSADFSYRYFWAEPKLAGDDFDIRNHIFMVGINYHF